MKKNTDVARHHRAIAFSLGAMLSLAVVLGFVPKASAIEISGSSATTTSLPLLKVDTVNPHYFTDGTRSVYLTGQHIPTDFNDWAGAPKIDFSAFVSKMAAHNHNYLRLWALDHPYPAHLDGTRGAVVPLVFGRSSISGSADGGNKFDLSLLNPGYFDRLRSRVMEAGDHGIYVSVMFANALFAATPGNFRHSMYNPANNINSVLKGMTNSDQWTMNNSGWVQFMDAYVDRVVDTLNDLPNVLYEVANEGLMGSSSWQEHVIDRVHAREAAKTNQHPVGKTALYGDVSADSVINGDLLGSGAEWVSLAGRAIGLHTVPQAPGTKVSIYDTDHIIGFTTHGTIEGTAAQWVWKSFLRGHNPAYITAQTDYPAGFVHLSSVERQLGYARTMADRCDLRYMTSLQEAASSGYALVNSGTEYLAYQPNAAPVTLRLPAGIFAVEWMNPETGEIVSAEPHLAKAGDNSFSIPAGYGSAVLHLAALDASATPEPTPGASSTPMPGPSSIPLPGASSTPVPKTDAPPPSPGPKKRPPRVTPEGREQRLPRGEEA